MQSLHARLRNTHDEHEPRPTDTPPPGKWLPSWGEWERFPVDALCLQSLVEPEIYHSNTEPGDQTSGSREVGEPGKDDTGAAPERHVGEERKARADSDGDVRQSRTRCTTKHLWSTARHSKTVCGTMC
jgi:hypothetical protein